LLCAVAAASQLDEVIAQFLIFARKQQKQNLKPNVSAASANAVLTS